MHMYVYIYSLPLTTDRALQQWPSSISSLSPVTMSTPSTQRIRAQTCFPSKRGKDSLKKWLISSIGSTKYKMKLCILGTQIRKWSRIISVKVLKFNDNLMVISDWDKNDLVTKCNLCFWTRFIGNKGHIATNEKNLFEVCQLDVNLTIMM